MKRMIALLLFGFLAVGLFGCVEESDEPMQRASDAETAEGSENEEETEELYDWTLAEEPPIPEEDYEVRMIADPVVKEQYNLPNLAMYEVDVSEGSDGSFWVCYRLMIGGYVTWEEYTVRLDANKMIINIYGDQGKYFRYLPYATPKCMEAAKQRLHQQMIEAGLEPNAKEYLTVNQNGELCFTTEVIVDIPNPSELGGGCGIDHDHKFFWEPICSAPAREPSSTEE